MGLLYGQSGLGGWRTGLWLEIASQLFHGCDQTLAVWICFNCLNDCTADDKGIGIGKDFPRLLRGADAEAQSDRQRAEASNALDEQTGIVTELLARAGDAGARNRIDKASGMSADDLEPLVGAGGRRQRDEVDLVLAGKHAQAGGVIGGQIGEQQAGDSVLASGGDHALQTILQDRIEIAEQHHRAS